MASNPVTAYWGHGGAQCRGACVGIAWREKHKSKERMTVTATSTELQPTCGQEEEPGEQLPVVWDFINRFFTGTDVCGTQRVSAAVEQDASKNPAPIDIFSSRLSLTFLNANGEFENHWFLGESDYTVSQSFRKSDPFKQRGHFLEMLRTLKWILLPQNWYCLPRCRNLFPQ